MTGDVSQSRWMHRVEGRGGTGERGDGARLVPLATDGEKSGR